MSIMTQSEEKKVWDILLEAIKNPYGVAAVMGNLKAESSMNPMCMTGGNAKSWTADLYRNSINSHQYSKEEFSKDKIAFGLVQWCYWSRKSGLYEFAYNKDIGDPITQIRYMLEELPKYKTVWVVLQSANSIREASDSFMLRYEQPANTSETMKDRRERYSWEYYNKYAIQSTPIESDSPVQKEETKMDILLVQTTANRVIVRCGNGTEYASLGRIENENTVYPWIADARNGWHAIIFNKKVGWVSPDFSKVVTSDSYNYA